MGRIYGYNRVSTKDQHLDRGRKAIEDFCASRGWELEKIYEDKQTGRNFDRPRYIVLKEDVAKEGDTIVVPEYDRLGRADETKAELEYFKNKGIRVIFLDIPTTQVDLSSMSDEVARAVLACINDMLISFYDLFARTEYQKRQKRQREGFEAKRARGEWDEVGRPRIMSKKEFEKHYERVMNGEISTGDLRRELNKQYGMSRDVYFRYQREYRKERGIEVEIVVTTPQTREHHGDGGENPALGGDALEFLDSLLTPEEIAESDLRVAEIGAEIEARKGK